MKRLGIEFVIGVLGGMQLASITIEFASIAGLISIEWRIAAIVLEIAVFAIAAAMVLVMHAKRSGVPARDPFAATTDELLWYEGMPDRRQAPRRNSDIANASAAKRLIEKLESQPMRKIDDTPEWAKGLQEEHKND